MFSIPFHSIFLQKVCAQSYYNQTEFAQIHYNENNFVKKKKTICHSKCFACFYKNLQIEPRSEKDIDIYGLNIKKKLKKKN